MSCPQLNFAICLQSFFLSWIIFYYPRMIDSNNVISIVWLFCFLSHTVSLLPLPWGCSNVGVPVFIISVCTFQSVWCLRLSKLRSWYPARLHTIICFTNRRQTTLTQTRHKATRLFLVSSTSDIPVLSVFTIHFTTWLKSNITKKLLTVTPTVKD